MNEGVALIKPSPRLIETWRDAEVAARDWIGYMGFPDAEITGEGPDGGIDVEGSGVVAQVKAFFDGKVGRPSVQALAGVGAVEGKECLFFSLSGFSEDAVNWATRANVALFKFKLTGEPVAVNPRAASLLAAAGRNSNEGICFFGRIVGLLAHPRGEPWAIAIVETNNRNYQRASDAIGKLPLRISVDYELPAERIVWVCEESELIADNKSDKQGHLEFALLIEINESVQGSDWPRPHATVHGVSDRDYMGNVGCFVLSRGEFRFECTGYSLIDPWEGYQVGQYNEILPIVRLSDGDKTNSPTRKASCLEGIGCLIVVVGVVAWFVVLFVWRIWNGAPI